MFALTVDRTDRRPISEARIEFEFQAFKPIFPRNSGVLTNSFSRKTRETMRNELILGRKIQVPSTSNSQSNTPIPVPANNSHIPNSQSSNALEVTPPNNPKKTQLRSFTGLSSSNTRIVKTPNITNNSNAYEKKPFLTSPFTKPKHELVSKSLKAIRSASSQPKEDKTNKKKQEIARISYLQEKMTRTDIQFKPSKRTKSNEKRNDSMAFLQEMEDKELEMEENELDQSFDLGLSASSLKKMKSNEILLVKSIYQNRPATIFFKYPPICQGNQNLSGVFKVSDSEIREYDRNCRITGARPLKCVQLALESAGFEITTEGKNWNVFWGFVKPETLKNMNPYQKTNHFLGCWHLGRKDNLYRHLLRMKQRFNEEYDFVPRTYLLGNEFKRFQMIRKTADSKSLWIMKPVNQACGRGIRVIDRKSKLEFRKDFLVSEYITNPHLINGIKYDLRVYVLITSFDPLRVYCYNEGLVRFATEKYSLSHRKIKKRYVHLTNYSVNKKAQKYQRNSNSEEDGQGSKWSHTAYRKKLREMGIDADSLFARIHDLIVKVCVAVESHVLHSINRMSDHRNNCFELFGFDVLIDENLKPWIMEVNVSPSLSSSSPLDAKIKTSLISDIMNLVGLRIYDKRKVGEAKLSSEDRRSNKNIGSYQELNASNCLKMLSTENWNILFENEEENARRGQFERIFPKKETLDFYTKFFENPTLNNVIWWQMLRLETDFLELICKKEKK